MLTNFLLTMIYILDVLSIYNLQELGLHETSKPNYEKTEQGISYCIWSQSVYGNKKMFFSPRKSIVLKIPYKISCNFSIQIFVNFFFLTLCLYKVIHGE